MNKRAGGQAIIGRRYRSEMLLPRFEPGSSAPYHGGGNGGRANGVLKIIKASVLLAIFLYETTGHEILELFVGAQTKHFFASANGIARLQVLVNHFEEIVEPEGLFIGEDYYQFIGYVIWHPS